MLQSISPRKWIVALAAIVLLVVAFFLLFSPSEEKGPLVRGRPVAVWLREVFTDPTAGKTGQGRILFELGNPDPALQIIGEAGESAVPFLIGKLENAGKKEDDTLLVSATERIPNDFRRFLPVRNVSEQGFAAILALAEIGPPARAAVPALRSVLDDSGLNYAAIYALGKIGPDAADAVPDLTTILAEEIDVNAMINASLVAPSGLRPLVLQTLGEIGSGANSAVPLLLKDLDEHGVRLNQVTNYYPSGGGPQGPYRRECLNQFAKIETNNRFLAATALWRIDSSYADKVVPILVELLEGDEFWDVSVAYSSLGKLDYKTKLPEGGRAMAARVLGEIGNPISIEALTTAAGDADEEVRKEASIALEAIKANSGNADK